jgi:hypothetical protein
MLKDRIFDLILVSPNSPVGFSFTPIPGIRMNYNGEKADFILR